MEDIKRLLSEVQKGIDERNAVIKHINKEINSLEQQKQALIKALKIEQFECCDHMWVTLPCTETDEEFEYFGCIKCGLNNLAIDRFKSKLSNLDSDQRLMFEYMSMQFGRPGTDTEEWCDLELGMAIYKKLREYYPDADNDTISNYFSNALWNMRTKNLTESRKEGRVKRLGLKPGFDKWNSEYKRI